MNKKIQAAQIENYGNRDVVKLATVELPEIGPNEVLIKVIAAGVNPVDWKIREGYLHQMAPLKFPATLGGDVTGMIQQVGKDVKDFQIGDEVYGQAGLLQGGSGSFAELVIAKSATIQSKPNKVNFVEAAGLPLVGVSAWQALVDNIGLAKGQKILIHGGAGGIGSIAIQLAKYLGAYVATTASADSVEQVKALGADQVD
jgi:NADPH:quinone reductase-like Zn-dependent oxidoreductase